MTAIFTTIEQQECIGENLHKYLKINVTKIPHDERNNKKIKNGELRRMTFKDLRMTDQSQA